MRVSSKYNGSVRHSKRLDRRPVCRTHRPIEARRHTGLGERRQTSNSPGCRAHGRAARGGPGIRELSPCSMWSRMLDERSPGPGGLARPRSYNRWASRPTGRHASATQLKGLARANPSPPAPRLPAARFERSAPRTLPRRAYRVGSDGSARAGRSLPSCTSKPGRGKGPGRRLSPSPPPCEATSCGDAKPIPRRPSRASWH
jgi:hypothetical protein